jgi:hypothetical protein
MKMYPGNKECKMSDGSSILYRHVLVRVGRAKKRKVDQALKRTGTIRCEVCGDEACLPMTVVQVADTEECIGANHTELSWAQENMKLVGCCHDNAVHRSRPDEDNTGRSLT